MTNSEDPLQVYGGLSFFTRTFPSLPEHLRSDDMLSAHNFLKSLPIEDQDKLSEQGKTILSGGCGLPAANPAKFLPSKDNGEAADSKLMEKPRERRPGLGRKRARFSLLPNFSQPSINLEPTLDIDKLKDPEEFFAAYERLEDAKKEIAKQTGNVQTSSYQHGAPLPSRPRRPGIPGRSKTAKYIHLYPKTQENSEVELLSPYPGSSQPVVKDSKAKLQDKALLDGALEENELGEDSSDEGLSGAVTEPGDKVDKILGELLSQDFEDLNEDKAVSLLSEKFQIKPFHIEELKLPEWHDIPTIDCTSSRAGILNKPRRPLSEIDNILKETKGRSFMKRKKGETSVSSFGSDSVPKSPLPSLARKLISQSDPLVDPFPFCVGDIGSLPETNASPMGVVSQDDTAKELDSAMIDERDHTVGVISSPVMADFTFLSDRTMEDDTTTLISNEEDGLNKLCPELEGENNSGNDKEGNENLDQCGTTNEMEGENNDGNGKEGNENLDMCGTADEMEDTETVDSAQPIIEETIATDRAIQTEFVQNSSVVMDDHGMTRCPTIESNAPEEHFFNSYDEHNENHSEEPPAVIMKESIKGNIMKCKKRTNKYMAKKPRRKVTKKSAVDDCPKAKHTAKAGKIASETHEQQTIQESLVVSANKQTKSTTRPLKGRESRALSRRKSLAGAGSSYATEGRLRRSTRIRSRPLEFWKGERFLYGRIHQSLATVIGIKYQSPGKDEGKKPGGLKVKSFVSDEYQHLVDLAALG